MSGTTNLSQSGLVPSQACYLVRELNALIYVISPLMSMLSYLNEDPQIHLSLSKIPRHGLESILFLPRLLKIFPSSAFHGWSLCLYFTGISPLSKSLSRIEGTQSIHPWRINHEDLISSWAIARKKWCGRLRLWTGRHDRLISPSDSDPRRHGGQEGALRKMVVMRSH